ncbi:MAG: hypothetical protein DHS80DRAFT_4889, partial [Piptocephalis tieghemiana]
IPSPPRTPPHAGAAGQRNIPTIHRLPSLHNFTLHLARRTRLDPAAALVAAIYLKRLRKIMPSGARGKACTLHRVLLASLLLASKYVNDYAPSNRHWAKHSGVFGVEEVNLMERQLLKLMDFTLSITEDE